MIVDKKSQADGMNSFLGGQDSGRSPNLIRPDQSAELWNCTRRKGVLQPRPGWFRRDLFYPSDEIEAWFATNHVQGCKIFRRRDNNEVKQIWSVGGRFFAITLDAGEDPQTDLVSEITPTRNSSVTVTFTAPAVGSTVIITITDADLVQVGYPLLIGGKTYIVTAKSSSTITAENVDDTPAANILAGTAVTYLDVNDPTLGICYMIQAEDFLIAQDGKSLPFIFDGSTSRRAQSQDREVPVGTVMAYGRGRLWVAIGGNRFVASDIVYGPTGTASYDRRDAILKFTENTLIAGGGAFTAPGIITAMQFASSLDVSMGQGPLMVLTEDAICSVNAPSKREDWAVITDPIQTISLLANGATSFYATVPTTNGDIFYRSLDGFRSFFVARREFGTWGNTPISSEVDNLIRGDAENLLQYCSAIVFDNRLLFTASSRNKQYGAYWKGLCALDFDGLNTIFEKSPPVYDGAWTGVDVLWIYSGKYGKKDRAFMAVLKNGRPQLWEITKSDKFDNKSGRIKWKWYSRAFKFNSEMEMVRLNNLELFPRSVVGEVDFTVRYRPDDYPCWFSWNTQPVCADYRQCSDASCATPPANLQPGYKTRLPFGEPPDTDELNDGKPARLGYTHQLSVEIEGYCELKLARLRAMSVDEEVHPKVDQTETCQNIQCCPDDNFAYRSDAGSDPGGEA